MTKPVRVRYCYRCEGHHPFAEERGPDGRLFKLSCGEYRETFWCCQNCHTPASPGVRRSLEDQ